MMMMAVAPALSFKATTELKLSENWVPNAQLFGILTKGLLIEWAFSCCGPRNRMVPHGSTDCWVSRGVQPEFSNHVSRKLR